MDPDTFMLLGVVEGCGAFIGALALIIVGLVSVRKVHAASGFMVAGAGVLMLLGSCCNTARPIMLREGIAAEVFHEAGELISVVHLLFVIGIYALIVAGMVMAAGAIQKGATK